MIENVWDAVSALGGARNVVEVESCATRILVRVYRKDDVDIQELRKLGVHGVSVTGTMVQLMVGPTSEAVAEVLWQSVWTTQLDAGQQSDRPA